jgi:hypothetical protein
MSDFRIDQITNQAGTAGPQIAGITTFSGSSGLVMPSGDTFRRNVLEDVVQDGLVLYLDAGNDISYPGSGTNWFDLSNNGNNGTLLNGVGYSASNGGSITFDGNDDYITCGNIPTIGTGDFAINCWVYLANVTPTNCWRAIVTIGNGYTTAGGITLYAPRYTSPVNTAVAILNGVNPTIGGTSNVNNSVWHHIVLTRLSNNLSIYVDSVSEVSTSNTANITQTAITIGRDINCGNTYYQGNIAQVSIYNRALSAAEVLQNYNALKGRFGL